MAQAQNAMAMQKRNATLKKNGSHTPIDEEAKTPQMKKVGNFLIDLDRHLGQGQYGKVYLA